MVEAPEKIWSKASSAYGMVSTYAVKPPDEYLIGHTEYTRSDIAERQIAELRAENETLRTRILDKIEAAEIRATTAEAKLAKVEATLDQLVADRDFEQSSRLTSEAQLGTMLSNVNADRDRLSTKLAEARAENKKQMHRATNAEYMALAYRNMLGPIGSKVARMWDEKHVNRVHFDWGPDARKLDGEQRAQFILDIEKLPSRPADASEIDGPDEAHSFLASKEASQ